MKDYFLDTSFIVDLINEKESAVKKHEIIKGQEVTGTPCVYELSKFTDFDISDLFFAKEVLTFRIEDAEAAGKIYYKLREKGRTLAEIDTIIAGIVNNRDLILVTRDSDFQRIEEIDVETY